MRTYLLLSVFSAIQNLFSLETYLECLVTSFFLFLRLSFSNKVQNDLKKAFFI